jgi:ribosomal protein S18 acetylase RimI-like enzyme
LSDGERAAAFLRATYLRRVEHVESHPWGEVVSTPSLPRVWDANFALVERWDGGAGELGDELERVQRRAGFDHRRSAILDERLAGRLWDDLTSLGWEFASRYLVMAHRRPPDRGPDARIEVLGVGETDWANGRRAMIATEPFGHDDELGAQLVELDRRLARSMEVRHLAAVVDGAVASYAGLYLEGGVAQIEDVATLLEYRGRGLARAVVLQAVEEARRSGAELVFLVADAADWPRHLYARLGFDPIGIEHVFGRSGRQHVSS